MPVVLEHPPVAMEKALHTPVMVREVVEALQVRPGGRYIDATLGEGGHTRAILEASSPHGRVLGVDRDPLAVERARRLLEPFGDRVLVVHGSYTSLEEVARAQGFTGVDGVLFDLGLSALHLEASGRGFSFARSEPLDMRYDPSEGVPASHLVNHLPEEELARLLWEYGEEPRARRIAREIVRSRPIDTSDHLARVVARAVGRAGGRVHPATRTFQALRIAVNRELEALEAALPQAIHLLGPAGRLAVLSYHSLEDRLVKAFLRREATGCVCPPDTPVCRCGHSPSLRVLTKKPLRPSPEEVRRNPRSRSARLRVAERR